MTAPTFIPPGRVAANLAALVVAETGLTPAEVRSLHNHLLGAAAAHTDTSTWTTIVEAALKNATR